MDKKDKQDTPKDEEELQRNRAIRFDQIKGPQENAGKSDEKSPAATSDPTTSRPSTWSPTSPWRPSIQPIQPARVSTSLVIDMRKKPDEKFPLPFPMRSSIVDDSAPPRRKTLRKKSSIPKPEPLTEPAPAPVQRKPAKTASLTKTVAADMFGMNSILGETNNMLFVKPEVESDEGTGSLPSGNTSGHDESWIIDWSGDEVEDDLEKSVIEHKPIWTQYSKSMNAAFAPLFLCMLLCGRLPFSGGLSGRNENVNYSFPVKSCKYFMFCSTSVFLLLILLVMLVSCFLIIILGDDADKYSQLELLYVEKYTLQISIFMAMLVFVTVCNFGILFRGAIMTDWMNSVVYETDSYGVDLSKWIWIYAFGNLLVLGLYFIYMAFMYGTESTPGVIGGTNAITVILFHFLGGVRVNLLLFPYLSKLVLVLQMYVLLCARLWILLPVLCSILVRNMAAHRNMRVGLILGRVKPLDGSPDINVSEVKKLKKSLTFRNVFAFNGSANRMLRKFGEDAFVVEICAYYLVKCCVICLCLYKIAQTAGVSFFGDAVRPKFNETAVRTSSGIVIETYLDNETATIFDALVCLLVSLLGLVSVTETFADCSTTFLNGFTYLRPHSLLGCRGSQERRFVLSLTQCFTSVSPYVVAPASLFTIDRRFLIGILEWSAFIFLILIQTQTNFLLKAPIYGLCEDAQGERYSCILGYGSGTKNTVGKVSGGSKSLAVQQVDRLKAAQQSRNAVYKDAEYCPGTDIIRLIGFDKNKKFIPLPADRVECIAKPYDKSHKYCDAFGNEASSWDDCGFPRFLMYALTSGKKLSTQPTTTKFPAENLECWNFQPGGTIGKSVLLVPSSEYKCGFPIAFAELLCSYSKMGLSLDVIKQNLIKTKQQIDKKKFRDKDKREVNYFQVDWVQKQMDEVKNRRVTQITKYYYIRLVKYGNDEHTLVRFIPFTEEGQEWPFRLNWKYDWAPYTATAIEGKDGPGLYYDCTGKRLGKFDWAGFLPFSYFKDDGTPQKPQLKDVELRSIKKTVKCFEIPWGNDVILCGALKSSQLFEKTVIQSRMEWQKLLRSKNYLLGFN